MVKMRDPRSILPMDVHPTFRKRQITRAALEKFIMDTNGLRSTYIHANFQELHVTDKVPTAATVMNNKTRRLALLVNPRFVRTLMLSMHCSREHRHNLGIPRRSDFMNLSSVLGDESGVEEVEQEALKLVVTHEFSHVWFQHLDRDSKYSSMLANIVHDSLLNFHMQLDPGFDSWAPMHSDLLFTSSITFPRWFINALLANQSGYRSLSSLPTAAKDVADSIPKTYEEHLTDCEYIAWRCAVTLQERAKKSLSREQLLGRFSKYVYAVRDYSLNSDDLCGMLTEMFDDLEELGNTALHQHAGIPCSTGDNHDDGSISVDGSDFVPMDPSSIPEILQDYIGEALQEAGVGSRVINIMLKDITNVKLSKETIKVLLRASTKSLLKKARKALDLDRKPSSTCSTLVPNRHPVISDLVRDNNLTLNREPRYKLTLPQTGSTTLRKVTLFVDTSGSMSEVWSDVVGFATALSRDCELELYQFSDGVHQVSMAEVKKGVIRSSGGTNLTPVVEKMEELSRTTDAFVVLGDREYAGRRRVKTVAQPIRLLDIGYLYQETGDRPVKTKYAKPWFRATSKCAVQHIELSRSFNVLAEGTVEQDDSSSDDT